MQESEAKRHAENSHKEYTLENTFAASGVRKSNGEVCCAWNVYDVKSSNEYVFCLRIVSWDGLDFPSRRKSETLWNQMFNTSSYNARLVAEFFKDKSLKRVQDGKIYFDRNLVTQENLTTFILKKMRWSNLQSFCATKNLQPIVRKHDQDIRKLKEQMAKLLQLNKVCIDKPIEKPLETVKKLKCGAAASAKPRKSVFSLAFNFSGVDNDSQNTGCVFRSSSHSS